MSMSCLPRSLCPYFCHLGWGLISISVCFPGKLLCFSWIPQYTHTLSLFYYTRFIFTVSLGEWGMCSWVHMTLEARGIRLPGARYIFMRLNPRVSAGKWTLILWMHSKWSSVLRYLSRPNYFFVWWLFGCFFCFVLFLLSYKEMGFSMGFPYIFGLEILPLPSFILIDGKWQVSVEEDTYNLIPN